MWGHHIADCGERPSGHALPHWIVTRSRPAAHGHREIEQQAYLSLDSVPRVTVRGDQASAVMHTTLPHERSTRVDGVGSFVSNDPT